MRKAMPPKKKTNPWLSIYAVAVFVMGSGLALNALTAHSKGQRPSMIAGQTAAAPDVRDWPAPTIIPLNASFAPN